LQFQGSPGWGRKAFFPVPGEKRKYSGLVVRLLLYLQRASTCRLAGAAMFWQRHVQQAVLLRWLCGARRKGEPNLAMPP
jgi:hypothetical protein